MEWTTVQSSNLDAVAFMDGVFYVRFKGGQEYSSEEVSAGLYMQLLAAPSKGSFFHEQIKSKFTLKKVEKKEESHA
jgi:hypothetical protein